MSSKKEKIQLFSDLARIEKKARDLYAYYVDKLNDKFLLERFKEIHRDEIKHLEMALEYLAIVSK